ncbi:MAG TPA: hypothetical protein VGG30_00110, partial [Pirellulales bacterium]
SLKKESAAAADPDADRVANSDPNMPAEPASASQPDASPPATSETADSTAGRNPASGTRLSRAPAPSIGVGARAIGAPRALAWLALTSCLLGVSFWAILGAGRKSN